MGVVIFYWVFGMVLEGIVFELGFVGWEGGYVGLGVGKGWKGGRGKGVGRYVEVGTRGFVILKS